MEHKKKARERHLFVVLTNPIEGQEDDFNRWYDERHIADILAVDGFVSAQRFKLAPTGGDRHPYGYLALYELETSDPADTAALLKRNIDGGIIPISSALSSELIASYFSPLGPRIDADRLFRTAER